MLLGSRAEWIAWTLEENGYSVVIQAWDFRPGGNFVLDMHETTRCDVTMAVLSPSYLEADFPQAEWAAAFAKDPRSLGVDGLRQAGTEDHLPRGLLTQSTHLRLTTSPEAALPALKEAQEIAERGHMLPHLAYVHLEYARLHLQKGDPEAARPHVTEAATLIQKTGYLHRQRDLAYL